MIAAGVLLAVLVAVYQIFIHYAAVMALLRAREAGTLTRAQRPLAYAALCIGLLIDFAVNVVICTLLFLEPPREWLVTKRLIRHKRAGSGWRFAVASWVCAELLDNLDPKGCHCRTD